MSLNFEKMKLTQKILNSKMKPIGSLGELEDIAIQMAGIYDSLDKPFKKIHIIACSDNGIVEENVSSCPQIYTKIVTEAMANSIPAISIMANRFDVDIEILDLGIKGDISTNYPNLHNYKISYGTENFYIQPAMTMEQCKKAIEIGKNFISQISSKYKNVIFSNGEMGIGNTTTSTAILYSILKKDLKLIIGRGSGLNNKDLQHKYDIIKNSCEKYNTFDKTPLEILSLVGGYDIACMVGLYLGAMENKKLMIVDGYISSVALLVACKIEPDVINYIRFSHISQEPGMKFVYEELKKSPPLNLNLRLGEGTGAILLYPIIECAIDLLNKMKTPKEVFELFNK